MSNLAEGDPALLVERPLALELGSSLTEEGARLLEIRFRGLDVELVGFLVEHRSVPHIALVDGHFQDIAADPQAG